MNAIPPKALLAACCGLLILPAFSADITVNNNPGAVADFTSLQAALNAAEPGDRLLLAGSATSYGNVFMTRNDLTLVGVGYLRDANDLPPDAGGNNASARFGVSFGGAGAPSFSGVSVVGCELLSLNLIGSHSDLLFDRCQIQYSVDVSDETNVRFTRCYLRDGLRVLDPSTGVSVIGCNTGGLHLYSSSVAANCVIRGTWWSGVVGVGTTIFYVDPSSSVSNLIIDNTYEFAAPFPPIINGSATHCIGIGDAGLPAGGGNLDNQTLTDVVVGEGSADAFWQVTESSPARGAASDGSDIGAFGGPSPYVLSGLPGVPQISRLLVPALASPVTGLAVEVDIEQVEP